MVSYQDVMLSLKPTHYYPLNDKTRTRDVVGSIDGVNFGTVFTEAGALFNGSSFIELPDHPDFSAVTKGALSVVVTMQVHNWAGKGSTEYIHWMGKGEANKHEWTFRHYCWPSGTGEAKTRPKRTSFYCFNLSGGLGAGSYFQDDDPVKVDRLIVGQYDASTIEMWKNGLRRDSDPLSGYNIKLQNGSAPVRIGTRDMNTGYLVGAIRRVAFFSRKLTVLEQGKLFEARTLPDGDATTPEPPTIPAPKEDYIATDMNLLSKHNLLAAELRRRGLV